VTTLLEQLADRLAEPVPQRLRERAARHLLDWLGCALAGAATEAGWTVARAVLSEQRSSAGDLTEVIGAGGNGEGRAGARAAALYNGCLGNVYEMDDVHRTAILHPGPVVIPAALASWKEPARLLDAIVRGYEAMIRMGRAVGPAHYAGFHNTATCGPFGAAAAAASALGLDRERTVWAMANAGSTSGGLWQMRHEDVPTKHLHAGRAAADGLDAALLAAQGFRGPASLLEGPQGFFAGLCPDGHPSRVAAPGDRWLIGEVSFKPWPACRHAHPAIDAALALREEVAPEAIESVRVQGYADALRFCDRPQPATVPEARFSLQHAAAVTLLRGAPGLSAFEPQAIRDEAMASLRARISVEEDAALTARFPERYGARVTVRAGGREHVAEVRDALGDPDLPLSEGQLFAKAVMLMRAGGVGEEAADTLCRRTIDLADSEAPDAADRWRRAVREAAPL
jgi:2-methylcitrate dehydratase PrpD